MMRHKQQLLHSVHCANLDKKFRTIKNENDPMTTYLLAENVYTEKRRSTKTIGNVIDIIISSFNQYSFVQMMFVTVIIEPDMTL